MSKKILLKSTFLLLLFSFIAKLLSVLAKIITTRTIGVQAMGYFSLVSPIMILMFTLGHAGLPLALSKTIASNYAKRLKIMANAIIIGTIINIFIMYFLIFFAPFIANNILKNSATIQSIYALAILTPLTCISGILKGYCMGVGKIVITSVSQIIEEIGRVLFIIIIAALFSNINPSYGAMLALFAMAIGEIFQSLTMILGNTRSIKRQLPSLMLETNKVDKLVINDILKISVPLTSNQILTSIAFFFEPIIMTSILINQGFSSDQIAYEYALFSSYALSLLFMPGFFSSTFSSILLPNMSHAISKGNIKRAKQLFFFLTFASLIIGIFAAFICYLFPEFLLNFLYKNTDASHYVKALAFPIILYYIEAPINSAMYSLSLHKQNFFICLFGCLIRTICLFIFIPKYHVFGIGISTIIEVAIIVFFNLFFVIKRLFFDNPKSVL